MLLRMIPVLVLFGLAGCANATLVTQVYYDHTEIIDVFRYAAGDRDFLVEVYGNPSTAPKSAFDGAVIAAMHGKHGGPPTEFTTTPSERARTDYRVVLVFGAPDYLGARSACRGTDLDLKSAPGDASTSRPRSATRNDHYLTRGCRLARSRDRPTRCWPVP